MKLMQFLRVDFKLYEINTNVRQECKFSKGKNTRILAFYTKTFLFLTHQYFFSTQRNQLNMTCMSLSLFKCLNSFETTLARTGFSVDNFKSTFTVLTSRLGSAINTSVMQSVK